MTEEARQLKEENTRRKRRNAARFLLNKSLAGIFFPARLLVGGKKNGTALENELGFHQLIGC